MKSFPSVVGAIGICGTVVISHLFWSIIRTASLVDPRHADTLYIIAWVMAMMMVVALVVLFNWSEEAHKQLRMANSFGNSWTIQEILVMLERLAIKLDEAYKANIAFQQGKLAVTIEDPDKEFPLGDYRKAREEKQKELEEMIQVTSKNFWNAHDFVRACGFQVADSYKDFLPVSRKRKKA